MNDQLTRGERIRLECLNMAMQLGPQFVDQEQADLHLKYQEQGRPAPLFTEASFLERAERFERWLLKAGESQKGTAN